LANCTRRTYLLKEQSHSTTHHRRTVIRIPRNRNFRAAWPAGIWLALGACLWSLGGTVHAAALEADGIKLKTPPANAQMIEPLRKALFAFDDEVAARGGKLPKNAKGQAKRAGSPQLLAELRGSGGAFATLNMADTMIDDMLADRQRAADQATVGLLFRMMGIGEAHAAVGCAFFWWVISGGYGTAHAYRSCYY